MGGLDIGALLQNPAFMSGLQMMLGGHKKQGGNQMMLQRLMQNGMFSGIGNQGTVPGMGPGEGTGFSPNRGWY